MAGLLGDYKVTLGAAAALVTAVFGMHQYMGVNFVTVAEAEQSIKTLSVQVERNHKLMVGHIEKYEIQAVQTAITNVRDQQWDLKVMVERDGPSALSRRRENELANRLTDLEKTERCMLNGYEHCK